jgi:phospholipid/cholesterol/gamma-HCH transport system substrate-binding protein
MKFKIRHADKIVGILTLLAVVFLIVTIFFLGSRQRWFQTKHSFYTILESASGVGENMPILYKGFTVGNVDTIELVNSAESENAPVLPENDEVKVSFHIFDEYIDRVREGSLAKVNISPIGLGNQFQFYPGLGEPLEEDAFIPLLDSFEARQLMSRGLTSMNEGEDGLNAIIAQASDLLQNLNMILLDAGDAIIGTDATALGRIIGGVDETVVSLSGVVSNVDNITSTIDDDLSPILQEVRAAISSLNDTISSLTEKLNDPEGLLSSLLASDGKMLNDLEDSLDSVSGTLNNIEKISGTQASGLIEDLRVTIGSAEDVLESLKNNPILKNGFTENVSAESGGNSPRDISF